MLKKYKVYFHKHAIQELDQIYQYIFQDYPNRANHFISRLIKQILLLETFPFRGKKIKLEKVKVEIRVIFFKKYQIYYSIDRNKIEISHIVAPGKNTELILKTFH